MQQMARNLGYQYTMELVCDWEIEQMPLLTAS